MQILLQVQGVSNTAPRQPNGNFQHAAWQIYQQEGFKANAEATAIVLVQVYVSVITVTAVLYV